MLNSLIVLDDVFVGKVYDEDTFNEIKRLSNLVSRPLTKAELLNDLSILENVDVIFSGWGAPNFNEEVLAAAKNLKIIFYAAGSIKKVVTDEFWKQGLRITTANTANAIPVAEFTLAATIMGLKNSFKMHTDYVTTKEYPDGGERDIIGGYKAKVGLISLGAIAREVLKFFKMFDYDVYVYDPFISDEEANSLNVTLLSLDDIFKVCDVVSLHTPLLDVTRGMIRKDHFLSMKENTTFINTARGAVVNEEEMIEALSHRKDITAYLDVVYPEPPAKNSALYEMSNVFLLPHIAGSEGNEVARMGALMLSEFKKYLNDEELEFEVSKEMFEVMA